jgi:hypothetical protein
MVDVIPVLMLFFLNVLLNQWHLVSLDDAHQAT